MTTNRTSQTGNLPKDHLKRQAETLRLIVSENVESYLANDGLQAKDLAIRIRKSRSWISKLLSGRQNATLDTLAEVAWALGAKWEMALVATDNPQPNELGPLQHPTE